MRGRKMTAAEIACGPAARLRIRQADLDRRAAAAMWIPLTLYVMFDPIWVLRSRISCVAGTGDHRAHLIVTSWRVAGRGDRRDAGFLVVCRRLGVYSC